MSTSRIASTEKRFFRGGRRFSEEKIKEGFKKLAGIYRSLKQVGVMRLKQEVAEIMIVTAAMSVSDCIQAVSYRVE